jgi:6-phosphogluconolactonase
MSGLVYIGSYTAEQHGSGTGIGAYRRDGARLAKVGEIATPAPSYLVADPLLPVIYAVNELTDGQVSSYAVDDEGGIRLLSSQPTGGMDPCHLVLHGGHLVSANYSSGSVAVHPVRDGIIGERTDLIRHQGRGTDPQRQDGPHAHYIHEGPGDQLTVVDLGLDRLIHLEFADGRLRPAGETVVPAGTGPRHLVSHPGGQWYVVGELESAVLTFTPDDATGWLRHAATGSATARTPDGPNQPSGIALSADGRRLYVGNRGSNTIATFEVRADGSLRAIGETGTGGDWPRQFTIADGLLFVANEKSNSVVTFRLDPVSGVPESTGEVLDVPSPACVLITEGRPPIPADRPDAEWASPQTVTEGIHPGQHGYDQ